MKIKIFGINNEILFSEEYINIIEIDNTKFFLKVVNDFNDINLNKKIDNEFVLFDDNEEEIDICKNIWTIIDVFNIDINSKKILSKLYDKISKYIKLESSLNEDFHENMQGIIEFIKNIINDLPFEYDYKSEISPEDLLKVISLKISTDYYETLQEKMFFLFDIISEFNLTKILIIPNLKTYFEEEELIEIYKYAKYKKINLLLIEKGITDNILKYEKKLIIDKEYDDFLIK